MHARFVVEAPCEPPPLRLNDHALGRERPGVEGGVARHGHEVTSRGEVVGVVTSGTFGPTVQKNIALGYVPTPLAKVGTELGVRIRAKDVPATVVKTPFFRRTE